jgi:acyl carrier protein
MNHRRLIEMGKLNQDLSEVLSEVLSVGEDDLSPDATLEEVGLDSLAVIELSVALAERLGVELEERHIADSGTLAGLDELVAGRRLSERPS